MGDDSETWFQSRCLCGASSSAVPHEVVADDWSDYHVTMATLDDPTTDHAATVRRGTKAELENHD